MLLIAGKVSLFLPAANFDRLRLIQGHETSSGSSRSPPLSSIQNSPIAAGMMTFMICHLLKNLEAMRKPRAQVDEVLGGRPVQCEDFSNLPYLTGALSLCDRPYLPFLSDVMRETLRLTPTVPLRSVCPLEDTAIGGGKYHVKAGTTILVQVWIMQRDPLVWGDDVCCIIFRI